MKIESVKRFVTHYAWTGPIIGFVVGFLLGPGFIWQYAEYRQKSRSTDIEQIRLEKDLYERLQVLQNRASSEILKYIPLRDRFFKTNDENREYQMQNEFFAAKETLVSLIHEYNRIEVRLSNMEGRSPRFFVFPLPPMAPRNLTTERIEGNDKEAVLKWDNPPRDPVEIEVENDTKALFQQYGHKFPSDK